MPYFKSSGHESLFHQLQVKAETVGNKEYSSALYASAAVGKDEIEKYVMPHGIKFTSLLKASAPWSTGEKALVKLAANIFSGGSFKADVHATFRSLDRESKAVAVEALIMRY